MEPYSVSGYVKMCRNRNKEPISYRDKSGKESKLIWTITLSSKLKFEKINSRWKGLEEVNTSVCPEF